MKGLRRLSIRWKVIGIVLLSTVVPLALGFAVVIINDVRSLRRELVDQTVLIARVTAENSVTDVAFNDRQSSQRTLSKLGTIPNIRWAAIFDAHGERFSDYVTAGAVAPATRPSDEARLFTGDELRVSEPVVYEGGRSGMLYLVVGTDALRAKVRSHLLTLLLVMIVCVGAAVVLALKLEQFVSRPILELAALAREVSERDDYSVRARRSSDDEVGILAEGFNEMLGQIERRQRERDDADRRTREKSQFLANMSHELRTPLNAIIGFSEVLKGRLPGRIQEREERFLENINQSGQHLLGIVNDILDLSKVEAGQMEMNPETFDLRAAVDGVCALMRGVSTRRGVAFELDMAGDLPLLQADPVKIKQVLYNLLSNAVKFSPDKSTVTIRGRLLGGADSVTVAVIDQGIGIDKKDHERIFLEFQQVDSTASRQFEGTGLGLTLVKKFLEMHGGGVTVESALGEGATFTITLPRLYRGVGLPARVAASAPARERLVLVIDDDRDLHDLLDDQLRPHGYELMHAYGDGEGLVRASRDLPSIVILDSLELAAQLRRDPRTERLPILAVTNEAPSDDMRQSVLVNAMLVRGELTGARLVAMIQRLTR
jgi:signal transduction histidine kinase